MKFLAGLERSSTECGNKATARLPETGAGKMTLFLFFRLRFCHLKRRAGWCSRRVNVALLGDAAGGCKAKTNFCSGTTWRLVCQF